MRKKVVEVSYAEALLLYLLKSRPIQIGFVLLAAALLARYAAGGVLWMHLNSGGAQ